MKEYTVAIVGATGAVGRELLSILEERDFPVKEIRLLSSERSAGTTLRFRGASHVVEKATVESFKGVEVAFFSAGASVSKALAPEAVRAGALVIDNTSAFRMDPEVPLVVPEVNAEDIKSHHGIIANPNCSTIIMVVPLKPIDDRAGIKRIVVSTYQAASGAGARAMQALMDESRACIMGEAVDPKVLPYASAPKHYQIAFNLIPQVDVFSDMYYTKEEWKMVRETQKILHRQDIRVTATTVRVPVFRCHSESVNLELEKPLTRQEAMEILSHAPGVSLMDSPEDMVYPMPYYLSGKDDVYVGRIREDNTLPSGLNLWVVGDQLRKGAALNAIQIGEKAIEWGII
ncbi:MAG TPA: aspartate-semialdehyde dehydrogenase [Firmicutes bacterium]|nr:aspartate-semialdehyde dehydrogenase [Bacillota bacterium]